jgi:hypothetical protein
MTRRRVFLTLAAALFAGWMIYLLQLALRHQHAIVVSRPQILVAEVIVIARVEDRDKPDVEVEEVLTNGYQGPALERGKSIRVRNLAECVGLQQGPQIYILPLESDGKDGFSVVPIPRSPGYDPRPPRPPPIYLDTTESRHQVEHILKP